MEPHLARIQTAVQADSKHYTAQREKLWAE